MFGLERTTNQAAASKFLKKEKAATFQLESNGLKKLK
jgi:hypothetical protein